MRLPDGDVKRPMASVSAIVDKRNGVEFGLEESYVEHAATGPCIPGQIILDAIENCGFQL